MLTLKKLSLAQSSTYYSKDNYYTKQQGEYWGKLKDELGLNDLSHENFNQLLNGVNPITGERLVHSKEGKDGNVPAFDFSFSPAKSISIAYELAMQKKDFELVNKILKCHDKAVNDTLTHIESEHIKARVQKNKKRVSLQTGNLVAGKFQHDINRYLEPQLHTHNVVFNFTKINGKYRALDAKDLLKKNSPIIINLGQYYRENLKQELLNLGFKLRDVDKKQCFYELDAVDESIIKAFSTRSQKIKEKQKELKKKFPHLSDSQLSMRAFFNTRVAKKDVDRDAVREENIKTLKTIVDPNALLKKLQPKSTTQKVKITEKDLDKAIKKTTKSIKNKHHQKIENIAIKTMSKLPNCNFTITKIYEKIKQKRKLQEEIKEEVKPLITMHDVVKAQLKMTRFNLKNIKKIDRNVNRHETKLKIEELLENAKPERANNKEITARLAENLDRKPKITPATIARDEREFKDFNRVDATQRIRARFRGVEFERPNDDSDRITRKHQEKSKTVRITREDLKKANQISIPQEQSEEISL